MDYLGSSGPWIPYLPSFHCAGLITEYESGLRLCGLHRIFSGLNRSKYPVSFPDAGYVSGSVSENGYRFMEAGHGNRIPVYYHHHGTSAGRSIWRRKTGMGHIWRTHRYSDDCRILDLRMGRKEVRCL